LVLYVSGETDNRVVFARACRRWDALKLLVANGGRSGLQAATDRNPRMVVIEAGLPDIGAEAFVRALRLQELPAGTPIVVVAHDGTATERARSLWAGATAYLTTPLRDDEIDRTMGMVFSEARTVVARPPLTLSSWRGANHDEPPERPGA
jgi:DNA-binding response OmpR family regulator